MRKRLLQLRSLCEALKYMRTEERVIVYSVAYDLKDDLAQEQTFSPSSPGDIVFELK